MNLVMIVLLAVFLSVFIIGPIVGLVQRVKGKRFFYGWKRGSLQSSCILFVLGVLILLISYFEGQDSMWVEAGIALIMAIILGIAIGTLISLIRIFFGSSFKEVWKITTITTVVLFALIFVTASMVNFSENQPYIEKMDEKFKSAKMEMTGKPTAKNILLEHYFSGNKSQAGVNIVMNNYNIKAFKGTLKVSAIKDGEVLGTRKLKVDLEQEEKGYSDFVYRSDLHIGKNETVNIIFKLDGEFYDEAP